MSSTDNSYDRAGALRRRRIGRLTGIFVIAIALGIVFLITGSDEGTEAGDTGPSVAPSSPPRVACDGEKPPAPDPQEYSKAPPMRLEQGVDYGAIITTSCGDINLDLLEDKAPQNVNNFIFLAEEGFYDGLDFHRVEQNSIIQAGDPGGTGRGGPGYTIPDELPASPQEYVYGTVAMANQGPNTAGSQFFIVVHDNPSTEKPDPVGYRPHYSIFGEVDPADEQVLEEISTQYTKIADDPAIATQPKSPIYIERIEITED